MNAKIPLLEGVGLEPVGGFCRSLIKKKPEGVELTLWRLSCNFTRTTSGLDLAKEEDKGTPQWVALLAP